MSLVPVYRPRASALHRAGAGTSALFCCSFALVAMLYAHPLVLGAALAGVVAAAAGAGVGAEVRRALLLSLPLALLVTLVNPLVYQEGDTLLLRGWELLDRRFDVTLEASAAGAFAGLRVMVIVAAFGLLSAAVDPDELLRLLRRVSYRSALTASLATRLVPLLARDAARMGDAARCRPLPPGRVAVARAAMAGALDRAVDVAAALEVRGYALAGRPARARRRRSRHDVRVATSAGALALGALGARLAGAGAVELYPRLELAAGPGELLLAATLVLLGAAPFAGRSARLGVARA